MLEEMNIGPSGKPDEGAGQRVLGLVPDIDSVSWALVDFDARRVLGMGVHRFNPPLEPKTGASLARKRRQFYYARINRRRTQYRTRAVMRVLGAHGLVPEGEGSSWLQSAKGDRPLGELRAEALDRALAPRELAQVLYYLSLHRGYDPRGNAIEGDPDSQKMLSSIAAIDAELKAGAYRTVGELLHARGRMRNRGGSHECTCSREMVEAEARAILDAQAVLGGPVDDGLADDYLGNLLYVHSSAEQDARVYSRVGCCTYFPSERRAAAACPTNEMLCALERLKHMRIVFPDGEEQRLTHEEAMGYLGVLFSPEPIKGNKSCRVRYKNVLRDLGAPAGSLVKGVLERDLDSDVYVPKAFALMRRAGLPPALLRRMVDDLSLGDALASALTYASSEEVLLDRLSEAECELSSDEIDAVCAMPYAAKAFSGYCSRSLKSASMLLEMMREPEVGSLYEAEDACGLYRVRAEGSAIASELPPFAEWDRTCTNPVVLRSTSRMRKVVNAVIRRYGAPDEVRLCLGRDLKRSKRERLNTQRNQSANRKASAALAETAAGIVGIDVEELSGTLLRKLSLWNSQDGVDVLTGAPIELERLCLDSSYAVVSHILPASVTGECGTGNSLLMLSSTAAGKGRLSPKQWCESGRHGAPTWDELRETVAASRLPYAKRERILEEDLDGRAPALLARSVNDTRYMSRAFASYISDTLLGADGARVRVQAVSDMAVRECARVWGLGDRGVGMDTGRALRAAAVACCDANAVRACARYGEGRLTDTPEQRDELLAAAAPFEGFPDQARAMSGFVVPTWMHDHGVTGEALEQTNRSIVSVDEDTGFALLSGSSRAVGNYRVLDGGCARVVGRMAMLWLWHDPAVPARSARKSEGMYYPEPIYVDDIPRIANGMHAPTYPVYGTARAMWPEVPKEAMGERPIMLHRGDLIHARGLIGRFSGFSISSSTWTISDPRTGEKMSNFPSIKSLCTSDDLRVVNEDVLGSVWLDMYSGCDE